MSSRKRRKYTYSDDLDDSTDDDVFNFDFSNMPKRQSRRQRGLDPDFVDPDLDFHD